MTITTSTTTQDFAQRLTVLGLFAHADDESLMPGGTLRKLVECGATVHIRAMTDSGAGEGMTEDRLQELAAAGAILGATTTGAIGFPDTRLFDSPETRTALVDVVEETEANLLITHLAAGDYQTDHAILGTIAQNTQHSFGRPNVGAPALVFSDQLRMTGIGGPRQTDLLVDVTDFWSVKEQAAAVYYTQGDHLRDYMELQGRMRGAQRKPRARYAEAFFGSNMTGNDQGLRWLTLALGEW